MARYYKRFRDESRGDSYDHWGSTTRYFEVGRDGHVTRQIEVYENDSVLKYDEDLVSDDYGGIGDRAVDEQEFSDFEISAGEFEEVWSNTTAANPRKWLTTAQLFSRRSTGTRRRMWATVLFGALPGTPLLLVVMAMQYNEVIQLLSVDGVSDVFEYVIGLLGHAGWFVLAALGIVGLWRVALQIRFVGRTNFYLLTAALVVLVPIVTPIIADAMYFRHSESVFVMVFLSPVVTSFAHLVAMVILHARNKPN